LRLPRSGSVPDGFKRVMPPETEVGITLACVLDLNTVFTGVDIKARMMGVIIS
jgi:hypothetical protein